MRDLSPDPVSDEGLVTKGFAADVASLPAGTVIGTTSTTRPTARSDIHVIFMGADPGAAVVEGTDLWVGADTDANFIVKTTSLTDPTNDRWADVTIVDDGSSTGSWVDRFRVIWDPVTGTTHPTFWLNEYGEFRGIPAKANTVGGRFFAAVDATDLAARDMTVPVFEVTDQRDGPRTTMFAAYGDGDVMLTKDLDVGGKLYAGGVEVQPDDSRWAYEPIPNATTAGSASGCAVTAAGTATASGALATTNGQTRTRHLKYRVTTAATTAIASARHANVSHCRGNGFAVNLNCGPDTGVSTTSGTDRFFMGLRGSTAAPTDVEPSSLTNIVGLGYDSADANVQIMHNDASGTATKVSTGWAVPTTDSSAMYRLHLWCDPGASLIHYRATNLGDGSVVTGDLTTDLPVASTFLGLCEYHSVGGTSSVVGIALGPANGRDLYL